MAGPSLAEVRARDWDRCVRDGSSRDLHVHHRKMRSQGGPDTYSNLVTLCAECHRWAHANPAQAGLEGLLLIAGQHPEATSVRHFCWPGRNVFLGLDGTIQFWGDMEDADVDGFVPHPRR